MYTPQIQYIINKDGKYLTNYGGKTWFVASIELAYRFDDMTTAQCYVNSYGGEITIDQR